MFKGGHSPQLSRWWTSEFVCKEKHYLFPLSIAIMLCTYIIHIQCCSMCHKMSKKSVRKIWRINVCKIEFSSSPLLQKKHHWIFIATVQRVLKFQSEHFATHDKIVHSTHLNWHLDCKQPVKEIKILQRKCLGCAF